MWHLFGRLTQQQANTAGPGRHAAGRGLWLQVDAEGTAGWQLTLTFEGVQQDVELGRFPNLSVRQARKAAAAFRSIARSGLDPAQQQEAIRNAAARNLDQFYC